MTGRGCSVDGCERGHHSRGLCKLHYERLRRSGTLGVARLAYADWIDDFWLLTSAGESPERVAQRLGLSPGAIANALNRRGETVAARPYWALDQRQRWAAS